LVHYFNSLYFLKVHPNLIGIICCGTHRVVEHTNVLKRSHRSLTSIICSFAQWRFNANSERLLAATKCSIALSKFKVVLSRISKYFKVCTCSITSPLNTNFWHGSTELNTMTFVFSMFMISPHSTQNYWSVSNCCYSPTFDSNVRMKLSTKK
jgi:hypothetical protein